MTIATLQDYALAEAIQRLQFRQLPQDPYPETEATAPAGPEGAPPPIEEWITTVTISHPARGWIAFEPYAYQLRLVTDRSASRLVLKARQTGISLGCASEALYYALHRDHDLTLFISKSEDDAKQLVRYVQEVYDGFETRPIEIVRSNLTEIEFKNGSRIRSLPASTSAGRGYAANRVYLDEFAFAEYAAQIYRSVRPTLSRGGQLTVLSTPDGQANLFFQLWQGLIEGEWSKHKIHWTDCPEYDDEWYARERPNYTARDWASEYGCDFVASGEAVFLEEFVAACANGWVGLEPPRIGGVYLTAWDIGRRRDATVGVTLDLGARYDDDGRFVRDDWQIVAFERMLGPSYPVIQASIEERAGIYPGPVYVESNGVGDPVIENLNLPTALEDRISSLELIEYDPQTVVLPWTTTARSKHNAISAMVLAVEHGVLKHNIEQLRNEMLTFQWDDKKLIQDAVIATAIACWAAQRTVPAEQIVVEDDTIEIGPQL